MGSGIIEANRAGGTVKRLHCGWAARAGITAAQLAVRGFTGPPTAIEGRFGLFQAFLGDQANPEAVTHELGHTWEAAGVFFKPYPANHFTHTGIDAAIGLRERGVRPDDIAHAVLAVAPPTVRTIGEPLDQKRNPDTGYQAQFSGPYTVAAGLFGPISGGSLGVGLADFTDALARDPARRALMARVEVVGEPEFTDIYPFHFPSRLTVRTTGGDTLTEEVLVNRGSPARPLSAQELAAKYGDNVAGLVDDAVARQMHETLADLDRAASTAKLLAPLADLGTPP